MTFITFLRKLESLLDDNSPDYSCQRLKLSELYVQKIFGFKPILVNIKQSSRQG